MSPLDVLARRNREAVMREIREALETSVNEYEGQEYARACALLVANPDVVAEVLGEKE